MAISTTTDSTSQKSNSGTLSSILTALQNGVVAINNATKTLSSTFPSSS